jgi:hypothetical protein
MPPIWTLSARWRSGEPRNSLTICTFPVGGLVAWADHEALGGAIDEIDTTAVLTHHDRPIDNHGVETATSFAQGRRTYFPDLLSP